MKRKAAKNQQRGQSSFHTSPQREPTPQCSVEGCDAEAEYEVLLFNALLPSGPYVFIQHDHTCLYICGWHALQNEDGAQDVREEEGCIYYPYTNQHHAKGFTVYQPLRPHRGQGDSQ